MKPLRLSFISLVAPLLLGCSTSTGTYALDLNASEYINTIEVSDISQFKICVFNDLHISTLTNLDNEFAYYEKCLSSDGDLPSLLVLDGDVFMDSNKTVVDRFFSWLDAKDLPFAYVYGNHDLQGLYSNDYINQRIQQCENSLLIDPQNDNVFGDSNYVVNISQGGVTKWQLYFFDSNTYYGLHYDVIHDDQIAWYEKEVTAAPNIPSLTFMHIPTEEFAEAYDELGHRVTSGEITTSGAPGEGSVWYMGESISWGYKETNLYETMQQYGQNKAIIVAHDHVNLTDWYYDKDGGLTNNAIQLIYGLKTGRGIYHDTRIMGASFYTLSDSGNFDIKWMNVPYEGDPFAITNDYIVNLGEGALV